MAHPHLFIQSDNSIRLLLDMNYCRNQTRQRGNGVVSVQSAGRTADSGAYKSIKLERITRNRAEYCFTCISLNYVNVCNFFYCGLAYLGYLFLIKLNYLGCSQLDCIFLYYCSLPHLVRNPRKCCRIYLFNNEN